jgi:agmatinase
MTRDDAPRTSDEHVIGRSATYAGALSFLRQRYTRELAAIRAASASLAWGPLYPWPFDACERLTVVDRGDIEWDFARPWEMPAAIEQEARQVLDAGVTLLALGGDHFMTLPLLRAHRDRDVPPAVIHFDAHSDTWRDDTPPGHAMRMDHGTMLFHAMNEGLIAAERSVHVGIRTHNPEHFGWTVIDADRVHEGGVAATLAAIRRTVGDHPVYLTFDIDCLDPAFAPGTGTPVAGGPSSAKILSVLRQLGTLDIVGADVVEVAPAYDHADITAIAGATVAMYQLGLLAERKARR